MVCWVCAVCNNENSHYLDKCDVCKEPGNSWEIEKARKNAVTEQKLAYEKAMQFCRAEKIRRQKSTMQITVAIICDYVLVFLKAVSGILVFIFILGMVCMMKEIGFSMDADSWAAYMSAVLEKVQILMIKLDFLSHAILLLKGKGLYMLLSVQNLAGMVLDAAVFWVADFQVFARHMFDSKKYELLKESLLFLLDVTETNNGFRNLLFLIIHNMTVLCQIVLRNITKLQNMF